MFWCFHLWGVCALSVGFCGFQHGFFSDFFGGEKVLENRCSTTSSASDVSSLISSGLNKSHLQSRGLRSPKKALH